MKQLSLGTKLLLGLGVAITTIMGAGTIYTINNERGMFIDFAKYTAERVVSFVGITLNDVMAGGRNDELPTLLEKIRRDESVTDLRIIRSQAFDDMNGYAPRDELDRQVLSSGETLSVYQEEGQTFRTIFPFVARGECLDCHDVPPGTVLGAASVTVQQPRLARQIEMNTRFFVIFCTVIILAMLISIYLVNRQIIQKPLQSLIQAARRFCDGDRNVRVEIKQEDEIGILARTFNRMIHKVTESIRQIEQQSREAAFAAQKAEEARNAAEEQREYFSRHVTIILKAMEQFSRGDLTITLPEKGDDMVSQLFRGFNRAVKNMQQTLESVRASVVATATAAAQISSATEQLRAGVHEQSQQAIEVAAAMEEMARTIADNADNAARTAQVAEQSGAIARKGGEVVQQTIDKMTMIADVVRNSSVTVEKLGDSGARIGEIISVIDEIADQSNLLALNAAIEAARAGEQGKGFAVVADEVRKLAERTTRATDEIAAMIESIQKETNDAVEVIQRGDLEVSEGMVLAVQAGQALQDIVKSAQNLVEMIAQTAAANQEQSTTGEQISQNVEAISAVSGESAQGVAQIAAAADELKCMADRLREQMENFRTETPEYEDREAKKHLCN